MRPGGGGAQRRQGCVGGHGLLFGLLGHCVGTGDLLGLLPPPALPFSFPPASRPSLPLSSPSIPPPPCRSIGCIFAEILLGKPLFPGRNVVHQLELITDLLGTPSPEVIAKVGGWGGDHSADTFRQAGRSRACRQADHSHHPATPESTHRAPSCPVHTSHRPAACTCLPCLPCLQVRNEKARRFLMNMRKKPGIPFEQYFPKADKAALRLLWRLLAFDPAERPTAGACVRLLQ